MYIYNDVSADSPYKILLSFIPEGEENAVSMRTLARYLDVECRNVRALVLSARKDGYIIASNSCGYFIPTDSSELRRYYKRTQQRQETTAISISAVRRKLKEDGEL